MGLHHLHLRDTHPSGPGLMAVFVAAVLVCGTMLVLAAPALAQNEPPPPPSEPPPPLRARPQPVPGGSGGAASDEDLEAAVLGTQPAPARSAPPQRAETASDPAPPVARPPVGAPRGQGWPAPARESGADDREGRTALALELGTAGLASGTLQGGLFLGARLSSALIVGGFLDYASTTTSVTFPGNPASEQSGSTFRLGLGARYPLLRTEDGRVELFGAGEVGLVRRTREVSTFGSSATNLSASGPTLAAGPGIRLWLHEHVAVGYAAQFRVTHLSGNGQAFPDIDVAGSIDSQAQSTDISLEGTFQLLGVF